MNDGQEAYLLRKTPYGERDYVLTLFTRESGKISGFAKNAKTSGKRFGGRIEPFVLFRARYKERSGGLMLVDDAETVRVFRRLMEDVELFLWGSLALETIDVLTPKDAPNEEMFEALTGLFTELERAKAPSRRYSGFSSGRWPSRDTSPTSKPAPGAGRTSVTGRTSA